MDVDSENESTVAALATNIDFGHKGGTGSSSSSREILPHGSAKVLRDGATDSAVQNDVLQDEQEGEKNWRSKLAFFKTWDFWVILILGQFLAICITGTNTLTTLLVIAGTSIPTFQLLFNYILLNLIYTSITLYKYGIKKWFRMVLKDGWKYFILAFLDVEGNVFTVLAYRYTTILSAQLINFWAIVIVVSISFFFLHVRYHWAQILGIFVCVAGMGILLASDHITGSNGGDISSGNQLKGDLFALAGATFYGFSNVAEEFLVSERPLYEVVGQLGFWAMLIDGVQSAIFDRNDFKGSTWNGAVAGYLTGFTLILTVFYTLVPVLYRLASAAFFNISLLTGNFWGVVIGLKVFKLHVHWMYPIAFTLIMVGHFVYYLGKGVLGEAQKAWLGERQEKGVNGWGTARRKLDLRQTGVGATADGLPGVEGAGVV